MLFDRQTDGFQDLLRGDWPGGHSVLPVAVDAGEGCGHIDLAGQKLQGFLAGLVAGSVELGRGGGLERQEKDLVQMRRRDHEGEVNEQRREERVDGIVQSGVLVVFLQA